MSTTTIESSDSTPANADRPLVAGHAPGPDQPTRRLVAVPTDGRRTGDRRGNRPLRVVQEAGMATAEYAVALIAACAFAAVLLAAIRTGAVMSAIGRLIQTALKVIS